MITPTPDAKHSAAATLEIYVLNLDSSPERWQHLADRAAHLGIALKRFAAVLGRDLAPSEKAQYTQTLAYHRALGDGEIGCYLSHLRCLEYFLAQSTADFLLILEDDVDLQANLLPTLEVALAQNQDGLHWDLLKLCGSKRSALFYGQVTADYALVEFHPAPVTTLAQVWSRRGAAKFVAQFPGCRRPIDVDLRFIWEHQLVMRSLYPPLVGAQNLASTIGAKRNRSKRHLKKWLFNVGFLLGRLKYSLTQRGLITTLRLELAAQKLVPAPRVRP